MHALYVNFTIQLPYAHMVWPTAIKFGMITCVGRACMFLGSLPCPDPEGQGSSVPKIYWPPAYAYTVWPTVTKFGTVTRVVEGHVSRGQPRLLCQGSSVPQIFGDISHSHTHGVRNSNQLLYSNQTRWEEKFYRVQHAPFLGRNFCDMNANAWCICGS